MKISDISYDVQAYLACMNIACPFKQFMTLILKGDE